MTRQGKDKDWHDEWGETRDEENRFWFPLLLIIPAVIGVFFIGFCWFTTDTAKESYSVNIYTAVISTIFTVGIIELFNQRRARQQLKAQLIREMGGRDTGIAFRALKELSSSKWLYDGSLQGADFRMAALKGTEAYRADLKNGDLRKADFKWAELHWANFMYANLQGVQFGDAKLQGATFWKANLEGAQLNLAEMNGTNLGHANLQKANLEAAKELSDEQLVTAKQMRFATMTDQRRYDGRFCLRSDIAEAQIEGVDIQDANAMANFYGVSPEEYRIGREWGKANLPKLRKVANSNIEEGW